MLNAVYPGTFDPLTNGHLDLIARASRIFPKVYVGVATSAGKHPLLSLEERLYCARLVCADFANVEPLPVTGLLKDFVMSHDVGVIVRGARAVSDFEYEFQMAGMNRQLMPEVETVFMTPSLQNQFVSGTFVREIARLGGDEAAAFVYVVQFFCKLFLLGIKGGIIRCQRGSARYFVNTCRYLFQFLRYLLLLR